jgi:hypothetical protein
MLVHLLELAFVLIWGCVRDAPRAVSDSREVG